MLGAFNPIDHVISHMIIDHVISHVMLHDVVRDVTGHLNKIIKFTFWLRCMLFQNVGYIIDIRGILGHYLVFCYESN